ncbi:Immunoglobulin E-set [Phytophthora cactorum]|nr:Immunoglobulin E-set [Phytophthora cactorum]
MLTGSSRRTEGRLQPGHSRTQFQRASSKRGLTTQNVKFLCCFNRGTCQLAITAMRCKLYQDITVKITKEGSYRTFTRLMCESAFPGVPPGASLSQPQPLTLISTSNSHLQPSTKSDLIACAYRIDVECDIPWCPDVRLHLPINILAPELPNPSAGWVYEECNRSAS